MVVSGAGGGLRVVIFAKIGVKNKLCAYKGLYYCKQVKVEVNSVDSWVKGEENTLYIHVR